MSNRKDVKPTEAPAPEKEENKILDAIKSTRNLDSETSKPRLDTPSVRNPEKKDSPKKIVPKSSKSAEMNAILMPYLRFPIPGIPRPVTSKFVPSAFNMYHIVHIMDDITRKNLYFRRQQDAWHPLISRLYFGVIFIIQTVRAELASGVASKERRNFLRKFMRTYPPETLPIPGPLVTLFENLTCTTPESTLEASVTPYIPEVVGPAQAQTLIEFDVAHAHQLIIPNIPMILGFLRTLTAAQANAIPDYSNQATFDDTADRNLNGHVFNNGAWTNTERSALMTPGLLYLAETDNNINTSFNTYGSRLALPIPGANNDLRRLDAFMYLRTDDTWFGRIVQIMETYCEYFAESRTLADCTATTTVSPLLTTEYVELSSTDTETNNLSTLTHAFPRNSPFTLKAKHTTLERELPPAATMLAQSAGLNPKFAHVDINVWTQIGDINVTRTGPYWTKLPIKAETRPEDTYKSVGTFITRHYALAKPTPK